MLACPSRAAEPIHPTRLYDQMMQCTNQTGNSSTTLIRRWTEWQPWGNPCRSLSLFLVPQSCRFCKLVVQWHDFCNIGPTLQFPKQYDEAIPLYARSCSSHVHSYYNYSDLHEQTWRYSLCRRAHGHATMFPVRGKYLRFYTNVSKEPLFDLNIASLSHIAKSVLKLNLTSDEQ